ncbi:MAG: MBOAT family protein [Nitrospirae bacterium]|nr:MBOAT family protein [Nitrospirota bacterium]
MLFNSYVFIFFFLPLTLCVYFFLAKRSSVANAGNSVDDSVDNPVGNSTGTNCCRVSPNAWLTVASLVFYGWWDYRYVPLMVGSIAFNYAIGKLIVKRPGKLPGNLPNKNPGSLPDKYSGQKSLLVAGIAGNLLLLAYFKYANFFIANLNGILNVSGISGVTGILDLSALHTGVILPLGISFFTFTQIAYLVDVYRGKAGEYGFVNYSLFVTFFPHLLAGPIIHHGEMMPQFSSRRNGSVDYENLSRGLFLFFAGLFKKAVIADTLAVWANHGFANTAALDLFGAWQSSLSYTLQLYFDFSGYTDMAIGASLMFNIRLPINFDSPYKATDIQDFWRRWHITLSRFLRDYVYIPLGGSRSTSARTALNLMATFLLGGLWHGAGWTFVLWGALHGSAMVIHRTWKKLGLSMHTALAWIITFNFINASWVVFRAKTTAEALEVLKAMAGLNGVSPLWGKISQATELLEKSASVVRLLNTAIAKNHIHTIALCLLLAVLYKNSTELANQMRPAPRYLVYLAITASVAILHLNGATQFIYYNF